MCFIWVSGQSWGFTTEIPEAPFIFGYGGIQQSTAFDSISV
jgi:hypothetical protein